MITLLAPVIVQLMQRGVDHPRTLLTGAIASSNVGFREEREWRILFQAAKDALAPINTPTGRIEIVEFRDGQFGFLQSELSQLKGSS